MLVDLASGVAATVVADGPNVISSVAMDADTLAWVTQADDGSWLIHWRARAGGPVAVFSETAGTWDPDAADGLDGPSLVIGQGHIAYLVPGPGRDRQVRVIGGDGVRMVDLPLGSQGLAVSGPQVLTATGGPASSAGVYAVDLAIGPDSDHVQRVATLPPATYPIDDLALSAAQVHFLDESGSDHSDSDESAETLWQLSVSQ